MLVRRAHLLGIPVVFSTAIAIANCTVKEVDDDGFGASGNIGQGGDGNSGNFGGFGGEPGVGGSGAFGGTGTTGGSGGECVGADGSGSEAQCTDSTQLPIAAGSNNCAAEGGVGGTLPPPGIGFCQKVYEIFNLGPADFFFDCIDDINVAPEDACDLDQVQTCFDSTVSATCEQPDVVTACDEFEAACAAAGDMSLSGNQEGTCEFLVSPFNDTGYELWADCLNNAEGDCLSRVESCWQSVTAIEI